MLLDLLALVFIAWQGNRRQAMRQDEWDTALVKLWEKGE